MATLKELRDERLRKYLHVAARLALILGLVLLGCAVASYLLAAITGYIAFVAAAAVAFVFGSGLTLIGLLLRLRK